jgi:hypothetical protein
MARKWPAWKRRRPDAELAAELAHHIRSGLMLKQACQLCGVRPGTVREWLRLGEEQLERIEADERGMPGEFGMFALVIDKAVGERAQQLVAMLMEAGAGKDSSPGSAGWLLERLERDFNLASRIEVSGPESGPLEIEGRAVVGISDVLALASKLGAGHLIGLDGAPARDALPPARALLPDPAEPEPAAIPAADLQGS